MGSSSVSIRLEGFSITIVDGNVSIEQTRTVPAATRDRQLSGRPEYSGLTDFQRHGAVPKAERLTAASNGAGLVSAVAAERDPPSVENDSRVSANGKANQNLGIGREARSAQDDCVLVTDLPPGVAVAGTASPGFRGDSGKGQAVPKWSDEEVERLRTLYPTHSASVIANELGRGFNAVRAKAQALGLKRDGPPKVIAKSVSQETKPAPKPRSLSAAVTTDAVFISEARSPCAAVPLLEHHVGQCRWLVSDVWPALYCGAPVVNSTSWCAYHSARVFNSDRERQRRAVRSSKERRA